MYRDRLMALLRDLNIDHGSYQYHRYDEDLNPVDDTQRFFSVMRDRSAMGSPDGTWFLSAPDLATLFGLCLENGRMMDSYPIYPLWKVFDLETGEQIRGKISVEVIDGEGTRIVAEKDF